MEPDITVIGNHFTNRRMSMDRIVQAVEKIRSIPDARIDQGIQRVTDETLRTMLQRDFEELFAWVAPNYLPPDYRFFLEYYGGLSINTSFYAFDIRGIGPMHNGWYLHIIGSQGDFDEGLYENGFLEIGSLSIIQTRERVRFFLDLGGSIEQQCIIGIAEGGPDFKIGDTEITLRQPHGHRQSWSKLADTFTSWIEMAAE